jgi:hypothetical protein
MSDYVTLDVAGVKYSTTMSTLTRYPESMLGRMFGGDVPSARNSEGHYLIDQRDPKLKTANLPSFESLKIHKQTRNEKKPFMAIVLNKCQITISKNTEISTEIGF